MPNSRTRPLRRKALASDQPANGYFQGPIPPPPVKAGRLPFLTEWVPLADEYPGWYLLVWRNHSPRDRRRLIDAATEDERRHAITRLARAHNGWRYVDEDGEEREYPPMDSDEFFDLIPNEVASAIYLQVRTQGVYALPPSMRPTPPPAVESEPADPASDAEPAEAEAES